MTVRTHHAALTRRAEAGSARAQLRLVLIDAALERGRPLSALLGRKWCDEHLSVYTDLDVTSYDYGDGLRETYEQALPDAPWARYNNFGDGLNGNGRGDGFGDGDGDGCGDGFGDGFGGFD